LAAREATGRVAERGARNTDIPLDIGFPTALPFSLTGRPRWPTCVML